jgi:hypothetical protein
MTEITIYEVFSGKQLRQDTKILRFGDWLHPHLQGAR